MTHGCRRDFAYSPNPSRPNTPISSRQSGEPRGFSPADSRKTSPGPHGGSSCPSRRLPHFHPGTIHTTLHVIALPAPRSPHLVADLDGDDDQRRPAAAGGGVQAGRAPSPCVIAVAAGAAACRTLPKTILRKAPSSSWSSPSARRRGGRRNSRSTSTSPTPSSSPSARYRHRSAKPNTLHSPGASPVYSPAAEPHARSSSPAAGSEPGLKARAGCAAASPACAGPAGSAKRGRRRQASEPQRRCKQDLS